MTGYEHIENEKEVTTYHQQDPQAINEYVMGSIASRQKIPRIPLLCGFLLIWNKAGEADTYSVKSRVCASCFLTTIVTIGAYQVLNTLG